VDELAKQLKTAEDVLATFQLEKEDCSRRQQATCDDAEKQLLQDVLDQLEARLEKLRHGCQRTGDRLSYYDHLKWEPPVAEAAT
jgi:molecular chaperone GrpE (heat shock protein)